jgi:hypothetical protein
MARYQLLNSPESIMNFTVLRLPCNSHVNEHSAINLIQFSSHYFDPKKFGMQVGVAELEAATWNTGTNRNRNTDIHKQRLRATPFHFGNISASTVRRVSLREAIKGLTLPVQACAV